MLVYILVVGIYQSNIYMKALLESSRPTSQSHPIETEPLPPELQPLMAADDDEGAEVNATDPIVRLFLKRQRRMKEVKKRREAGVLERLERFAGRKYYTIRRGCVPTSPRTHGNRQSA